jgi:hypothetical protein
MIFFKIFAIIVVQVIFQAMNVIVSTNFLGNLMQTDYDVNGANANI